VLGGASVGRAFLEARQEFAQSPSELDPFSLKTLAQFTLLGDPSIVPVEVPAPPLAAAGAARPGRKVSATKAAVQRVVRADCRRQLTAKGLNIAETQATAVRSPTVTASPAMKKKLANLARRARLRRPRIQSFTIKRPAAAARVERAAARTRRTPSPNAFHVVFGRRRGGGGPVPGVVGIVAKTVDGRIVATREVHRR
jgi:hypothetical protein